jgi:hypothetical protein
MKLPEHIAKTNLQQPLQNKIARTHCQNEFAVTIKKRIFQNTLPE